MARGKTRKFYAVAVGHEPGVYDTWELCRAQVNQCPGARFKSFASRADAEAFVAAPRSGDGSSSPAAHVRACTGAEYTGAPAWVIRVRASGYAQGTPDAYGTYTLSIAEGAAPPQVIRSPPLPGATVNQAVIHACAAAIDHVALHCRGEGSAVVAHTNKYVHETFARHVQYSANAADAVGALAKNQAHWLVLAEAVHRLAPPLPAVALVLGYEALE